MAQATPDSQLSSTTHFDTHDQSPASPTKDKVQDAEKGEAVEHSKEAPRSTSQAIGLVLTVTLAQIVNVSQTQSKFSEEIRLDANSKF